jgi:membrane protease YdiL (CAAX protease family)
VNVLLNSNHELRAGWKFALYVLIYVLLLMAAGIALSIVFVVAALPETDLALLAENVFVLCVPGVLTLLFMARFVEHAPVATFGVCFHEHWRKDLRLGLGIAAGMLGVMLLGSAAFGQLRMTWTGWETPAGMFLFTLLLLTLAAANEELVFRGYPMQIMMRAIGPWPAMLFMSIVFGLLHMNNPNATPLGTVNTIIAGVMLSLAYLKTRSLWLPFGIHAGWNVGLGMILGFPLSGIDIGSLWTSRTTGADFIVGGGYGPEGGLLTTFIFGMAAVAVRSMRAGQISPAMLAMLARASDPAAPPEEPGMAVGGDLNTR